MEFFIMKKILLMACLALFSGVVCSCSDDEDDNNGGGANASVSINGQNVNFSYAYYAVASDGECEIIFSNVKMTGGSAPQRYSMFMISVPAQNGQVPAGTFDNTEYDVTLLVNSDLETENYDYYLEEAYRQGGNLVIGKDGGAYTISISDLRLEGEKGGEGGEAVSVATSFSYTGALQKIDIDII